MLHNKHCLRFVLILGAILFGAGVATAQEGDFTFRRIKPPTGTGPKINVQVTPITEPVKTAEAAASDTPSDYDWFWKQFSSDRTAASPARIFEIEKTLSGEQAGALPRLQPLQDIAEKHGRDILRFSVGTDVSPALALAVIAVESGGKTTAESAAGAQGLMQLMPAAAQRFGVTDRTNPSQNIKGGIAYLDVLMKLFEGDPVLVLAGYNAGENAVARNGGVPPYAETRNYVPKVLAAWAVAKGLCLTPPELISDGCVFRASQ